jgi:hypothetical protein
MLPKSYLPKAVAVVFALILVALIGQTYSARAVGIGGTCAGVAGLGCDAGLWCELEPGTCKRAACMRRKSAISPIVRFAPAARKPTATIANASGPRRKRRTPGRAGSGAGRRTVRLRLVA